MHCDLRDQQIFVFGMFFLRICIEQNTYLFFTKYIYIKYILVYSMHLLIFQKLFIQPNSTVRTLPNGISPLLKRD